MPKRTRKSLSPQSSPDWENAWYLSGLYTWEHLTSSYFRWNQGPFGERWWKWQQAIRLHVGRERGHDPVRDFLGDLLHFSVWDSSVDLLDFQKTNERIGGIGDLMLLCALLDTYFKGQSSHSRSSFFDSEETESVLAPYQGRIATASVAEFHRSPWSKMRQMPHGFSVPIFDCRKKTQHVVHPYLVESSGWPKDPLSWADRLINGQCIGAFEYDVRAFVHRDLDLDFREHGVSRFAIILRPVTVERQKPESVLRSLISAIWLSMRETRNLHRLEVAIPEPPSTMNITAETLEQVVHRLDDWIHQVARHRPDFVNSEWKSFAERFPGAIELTDVDGSSTKSTKSSVRRKPGVMPIANRGDEQAKLYMNIWDLVRQGKKNSEISKIMDEPLKAFIQKHPKKRGGRSRMKSDVIRAAQQALRMKQSKTGISN